MAFEIGQRVGDYEILELLGSGGMGHVYRARNIISDRIEAMKVLLPDLSAERDLAVRFISEIRTLAGFDHPNIALLHTAFQSDNQLIMIMEYVEGYTLEQRAKQSKLTVAEIADYTSQALAALSYAHQRNVIHRDIKPANLMVTSHGVLKLMDFGIAKSNVDINLTRPGTTIGSFYYMSPEQVRGSTVDGRSDLYSLGIVLYELLAGRRPFESDSTYGVLNQQLNEAPQPPIELNPSLSPQLNAIILTALAKDPADRFQNADAFRNALKSFRTEASPAEAPAVGLPKAASVAPSTPAPNAAAFKEVAAPQQPPVAAAQATPQKAPRNNKPLWIATGALAAMLALVAVALMVPRLMKTHASESAATPSPSTANQPAATPSSSPADSTSTASSTATSAPLTAPADTAPVAAPTSQPAVSSGPGGGALHPSIPAHPAYKAGARQAELQPGTPPQQPQTAVPPKAEPSQAETEQLQERMIQLGAKADAVDRSLSQLRRQQEADGLGLRNDMEAADSRLRSYMQAANQDMQASRIAAANRNMDKAEAEIQVLEKFLGR
jgi:serine/threonine protein kinase